MVLAKPSVPRSPPEKQQAKSVPLQFPVTMLVMIAVHQVQVRRLAAQAGFSSIRDGRRC